MASLSAAWTLANQDPQCEITVYQLGWRLGGKGASSRNPHASDRIEEHGLHIWFGCYHNAFRVLKGCYDAVARAGLGPRIEHAFHRQDRTPIGEFIDGSWRFWPVSYPRKPGDPWADVDESIWSHLVALIKFADQMFDDWQAETGASMAATSKRSLLESFIPLPPEARSSDSVIRQCVKLAEATHADPGRNYRRGPFWLADALQTVRYRRAIRRRLRQATSWMASNRDIAGQTDKARRSRIAVDLALTVARGVFVDGLLLCGLQRADGEDFRTWLERHGAEPATVWSGLVRALYDLVFAYEDGETGSGQRHDPGKPNLAAGTALEVLRRIAFTYTGSVCYEMQAGMGEVVFAPMYRALKAKGVRFEFFNRVKELVLSADGKSVDAISIGRQVKLKHGEYQPLIVVGGVECWPYAPLVDQIVDGSALEGVNLESHWNGWSDVEEIRLTAGEDYDDVILGISLATLDEICGELMRRKRRWRNMTRKLKTIQTQSVQLWTNADLRALGWRRGSVSVDACPEPLDVWKDMSHFLSLENWPAASRPGSIQYLCGPLPGDFMSRPKEDQSVPEEAVGTVRQSLIGWLRRYGRELWPNTVPSQGQDRFDWNVLYDPAHRSGVHRLEFQYLRANIDPSERYVLSVAGSTRYRLSPGNTGCRNLFVAGDWTQTPYNASCIEAATISGIDAANAITGTSNPAKGIFAILAAALKWVARALCMLLTALAILGRRGLYRIAGTK